MKKWQVEVMTFFMLWLLILLLTGYAIGAIVAAAILTAPSSWISGWIWNKYYAQYKCDACSFTGATKEEIQGHITKKHKEQAVKYSKIKK